MASEAERRMMAHSGVELIDEKNLGGLQVWRVFDFAVIRFKKQDEDGRSRNYPTDQAKDYDRGLPLPGLPAPAARLTVGYLLDKTNSEFVRTQVARPLARTIDWCAAIIPVEDRVEGGRRWVDVTRQRKF